jgi:beta-glucanase (GH16 family)
MRTQSAVAFVPALFSTLAIGIDVASYAGYNVIWSDTFGGSAGSAPSSDLWTIAQSVHTNNEVEVYTTSSNNVQLSGGETIQFIPRKSSSGTWTSGRIESIGTVTPAAGKVTLVEASIRFGDASAKQGIWPAFWMLGDSMRHGTAWPACGELDIMETVNGVLTGYGTAHCGTNPGGICDETTGLQASTALANHDWHTWSIKIDRSDTSTYRNEVITWMLDGNVYHTLTGAILGDEGVWGTLAHSPLYIILNLAVGGDWYVLCTLDSWY